VQLQKTRPAPLLFTKPLASYTAQGDNYYSPLRAHHVADNLHHDHRPPAAVLNIHVGVNNPAFQAQEVADIHRFSEQDLVNLQYTSHKTQASIVKAVRRHSSGDQEKVRLRQRGNETEGAVAILTSKKTG
jgi:hypothetical protein